MILTKRQRQVLRLIALGDSYKEVGYKLKTTENNIKAIVHRIRINKKNDYNIKENGKSLGNSKIVAICLKEGIITYKELIDLVYEEVVNGEEKIIKEESIREDISNPPKS